MIRARRKKVLFFLIALVCFSALFEIVTRIASYATRREQVLEKSGSDCERIVFLCLGDSVTFGFGAERGEDYPMQLAPPFRKLYPNLPVNVYNIGVPGTSTSGGLGLLKRFFAAGPDRRVDYAFIMYGLNNLWNLAGATFWEQRNDATAPYADAIRNKSRTNELFRADVEARTEKRKGQGAAGARLPTNYFSLLKKHGWNLYFTSHREELPGRWIESDLSEMSRLLRERGIEPFLLTYHYPKLPELSELIREIAGWTQVQMIDTEKPFTYYLWRRMLDKDMFHMNAKGYKDLAVRIMAEFSVRYSDDAVRGKLSAMREREECRGR